MGRLTDMILNDSEVLNMPAPEVYPDHHAFAQFEERKRQQERRIGFIRDWLTNNAVTMKEMTRVVEAANGGDKAKTQEVLQRGPKTSLYKQCVMDAWKQKDPAAYNKAREGKKTAEEMLKMAEKAMTPAQMDKFRVIGLVQHFILEKKTGLYFGKLEEGLSATNREALTRAMEKYKDPYLTPLEEQMVYPMRDAILQRQSQAAADLAGNPQKMEKLNSILEFADKALAQPSEARHEAMNLYESTVQHIGSEMSKYATNHVVKTFENGKYDNFMTTTTEPLVGEVVHVTEGKEEVMHDLKQNGIQLSDRMKEGLRKMVNKFREMEILPPGKRAPGEDGNKTYGFRAYEKAYKTLKKAIQTGTYDEIIAAGETLQKARRDMEDLYAIAREYFHCDPDFFPGNLDSVRNYNLPADLTHDLATTGAVNGAFLVFNFLNSKNMDLEEYLANPLAKAYSALENNAQRYCIDGVTQGQPFEKAVECLMDVDDEYSSTVMEKTIDMGVSRTGDFLSVCEPDENLRMAHRIKDQTYYQYSLKASERVQAQFGVLSKKNGPEKIRTLQNLITVKHGDIPVSQLIDGRNLDLDLIKHEPFNIDNYAAQNADYAGMMVRTDTLLQSAGRNNALKEQILEAAQEAMGRVLRLHGKEAAKPEYQQLLDYFRGLEQRIPQNSTQEVKNRMATRRENLEMTMPEASATSKWTDSFYDRLQADGVGLSEENRNQLNAVLRELKDLKDLTAPYYEADEQGNLPKVTGEQYTTIQEHYRRLADAIGAFVPQEGSPEAAGVARMMTGLKQVVGQDLTGLSAAKQGEEATLSDMLKQGRTLKVTVDGPLENVGDMASTRLRVEIPGPNGTKVKGFFTPESETYDRPRANALMESAIRHALQKVDRPEFAELARTVVTREMNRIYDEKMGGVYLGNGASLMKLTRAQLRNGDKSKLLESYYTEEENLSPQEVQMLKNGEAADFVATVLREMAPLNTVMVYDRSGLAGNLDRRNSAMSTVADLLGASHLLAGSRPMTMVNNGKEMKGTFMSFAQGWDAADVRPENPLAQVTNDQMVTKESLTSLADLQVLDFICGNADRHAKNFFYQFDDGNPPKFTGVQGIDNDFSFTVYPGAGSVALGKLGIITEQMAQKVMTLTPALLEVTLSPYGLSREEIDAAWERTHQLQGQIEAGREYYRDKPAGLVEDNHIRVVKEEELGDFRLGNHLFEMGIFAKAVSGPGVNQICAQEAKEQALDEHMKYLRNGAPAMEQALNAITDANRGFFIGSKAYDNAMKGFRDVVQARNQGIANADPQTLDTYAQQLQEAKSAIETYLLAKIEIPMGQRSERDIRRIEAMTKAYTALDNESLHVTGASAIAKKLPITQDPELMARKEQIDASKAVVACHTTAEKLKADYDKPANEYECAKMKQFREQVRDQLYGALTAYRGGAPTEEQKAELTNVLAATVSYGILVRHIDSLKTPEAKQNAYQQLQQHPEIFTVVKSFVAQSAEFGNHVKKIGDTPQEFRKFMTVLDSHAGVMVGSMKGELIDKMKAYDKARSAKKEEPQASLQGQQKEVEAGKPSVVSGP